MAAVHPRACGERSVRFLRLVQSVRFIPARAGNGSRRSTVPSRVIRFIPARAGNGNWQTPLLLSNAVHPRACGERHKSMQPLRCTTGSSPRVRGTVTTRPRRIRNLRFIPARAGNGLSGQSSADGCTVHPRACGEREDRMILSCMSHGSSPRVRGTVLKGNDARNRRRFIPARAGNGGSRPSYPGLPSVHPRACGERCR